MSAARKREQRRRAREQGTRERQTQTSGADRAVGHQRGRRVVHAQHRRRRRPGPATAMAAAGRRRPGSRLGPRRPDGRRRRSAVRRLARRPRQRPGRRAHRRRPAAAGRCCAARPRHLARHRPHPAARRRADRVGAHVRSDAGLDDRRPALRRLGRHARGGPGHAGRGRDRLRAVPRPWRRRSDDRHHLLVDADLHRSQRGARQHRLFQHERGHRSGAALRRQRSRRHRAAALDRDRARADRAGGARGAASISR